jgi:hypothetical protein
LSRTIFRWREQAKIQDTSQKQMRTYIRKKFDFTHDTVYNPNSLR